jgi:hypothetical protein
MTALTKDKEIESLFRMFGFRSKEEFVRDAVEEKTARLKFLLFSHTATKVGRSIAKKGLRESDILDDFEQFRHA